jgi:putative radical SAM enzyme (TIGR03279 family)
LAKIIHVEYGGLARAAGIRKGEEVVAIDGRKFADLLDYAYADGQNACTLTVKDRKGCLRDVRIIKEGNYDSIGLEFDQSVEIQPRSCCNRCKFCFVDQLPKGMRDTLYIKDDDYRLSFTCGSYITGTNLTENDILRILEYKLSPLYVSVHATDETVRRELVGIRHNALPVMDFLKRLTCAGIRVNTQVVLCPGYNDGAVLEKTLEDLWSLGKNIVSLAVVPVGLTGHREGLPEMRLLTKEEAGKAIDTVEAYYNLHPGFCYCSDEMYLQAGRDVKDDAYYGGYEQLENGVGLVTRFIEEVKTALENAPGKLNKRIALITGEAGMYTMEKVAALLKAKWKKMKIDLFPIRNEFFGTSVTVSGLVTGRDIVNQLKDKQLRDYDHVILPSVMLKEFDTVFLDGLSVEELEKELDCKVLVSAVDGDCFVDTVVFGE